MASLIIGTPLGAGAYGAVFHATWEGRKVAIKKCHISQNQAQLTASIQQEIQLLERLRDKQIIQFYGKTYHEGMLVLAMEYAEGGSLERAIEAHLVTDWPTKARIAQEIARGLSYIHHKHVLHRDLKSANVLLTRLMEVKLCDFGLATVKVTSVSQSNTGGDGLKGTFRWMAPEVCSMKPKYSTKSDIYALAMVMWEMAANCTVPFKSQLDNFMVASVVRNGEREDIPVSTPNDYRQWIERCWDQDPAKRPEASEMVMDDLVPKYDFSAHGTGSTLDLSLDLNSMSTSLPSSAGATAMLQKDDLKTLLTRAKGNDVEAMVKLAGMYDRGDGVPENMRESFRWYLNAAKRGHSKAQMKTADNFHKGYGTRDDDEEALTWYQMAAEQGDATAQYEVAYRYNEGIGTHRQVPKAMIWYHKAAEQGHCMAQYRLGVMYLFGCEKVKMDQELAYKWMRRAADQGQCEAQHYIGYMFDHCHGFPPDQQEAKLWYGKAAAQGYSYSIEALKIIARVENDKREAASH